jgi:hypothetical protein
MRGRFAVLGGLAFHVSRRSPLLTLFGAGSTGASAVQRSPEDGLRDSCEGL